MKFSGMTLKSVAYARELFLNNNLKQYYNIRHFGQVYILLLSFVFWFDIFRITGGLGYACNGKPKYMAILIKS